MSTMPVDWPTAARLAGRLTPAGPPVSREEARLLVADLRAAAVRARGLAVRASGLAGALDAVGRAALSADVRVVDRPGWARAAAASFAGLVGSTRGSALTTGTTGQVGAVLALLAGKVLGQFDPYADDVGPGGRLVVVAPNVLRTERALRVDATDFRLWVCAHEQTHALQFAAAPWLADHVRAETTALLEDVTSTTPVEELSAVLTGVLRLLRGTSKEWSLLDALPSGQRERVERLGAVMSLLEGHADVTMDAVGPRDIASVRTLRARLDSRRAHARGADRVLRRLLGLDAKLAQYRNGAAFVRAVRAQDPTALDAAWVGPDGLPRPAEIAEPERWLRRVHG